MNDVVAFDLDGTLLDSKQRHKIVLDKVLDDFGIQLDTSDLITFKLDGYSNKDYLIRKKIVNVDKICAKWIELIEVENYLEYDKLYNDTISFLEFCKCENYKIVLVTIRANKFNAYNQLKKLKIFSFFDSIFVLSLKESKTKVLIEQKAKIFIGDTELDKYAADNANVKFFALNRGFRSKNFWDSRNQENFYCLKDIISRMES